MARMRLKTADDTLVELITDYIANKSVADNYKKLSDNQNKQIKNIMLDEDKNIVETDVWKAICTISERESMNEELLLDIIKEAGYCVDTIIKTKEYVDFDALEHAIYNNQIPQETLLEIDKAREIKRVVTLRVTKKKGVK